MHLKDKIAVRINATLWMEYRVTHAIKHIGEAARRKEDQKYWQRMTEKRQTTAIQEKVRQEIHQSAVSNRCSKGKPCDGRDGTRVHTEDNKLQRWTSEATEIRTMFSHTFSSTLERPAGGVTELSSLTGGSITSADKDQSHTPPSGTYEEGRSSRGT